MKIELNKKLEKFLVQLSQIMREKGIKASVQAIVNNMLLLDLAENHDLNLMSDEGFIFPSESEIDEFIESFSRGRKIWVKGDYDDEYVDYETPEERIKYRLELYSKRGLILTKIVSNKDDFIEVECLDPEFKTAKELLALSNKNMKYGKGGDMNE